MNFELKEIQKKVQFEKEEASTEYKVVCQMMLDEIDVHLLVSVSEKGEVDFFDYMDLYKNSVFRKWNSKSFHNQFSEAFSELDSELDLIKEVKKILKENALKNLLKS